MVPKRYEEEREQTGGKKVRDCRKAVLLWDEGLSYPLNTSVCAAA